MNYKQAREYIEETNQFGSVLGLENMYNLLEGLDNPQNKLKFIHIAGTNGKGSTLAYISNILKCNGQIVGRYISPTIFHYRERIQVDGQYIEKDRFAELMTRIKNVIDNLVKEGKQHPTSFEIETALAFLYFLEKKCHIVVLETGLGGTLDATNVIKTTICSVITTISMDHMQYLGDSLKSIATHKAGIIKPGCFVVSAFQLEDANSVIINTAKEKNCELHFVDPQELHNVEYGYETQSFLYKGNKYTISLAGSYQIKNAALAIEVIKGLNQHGWNISEEALYQGLKTTKWMGRFTLIHTKPVFIVDGAHNEDAARQLRESIELYFKGKRIIFIMGVFADKDYKSIIQLTVPLASTVITIETPDNPRAMSAISLANEVSIYNSSVKPAASLQEAVDYSLSIASEDDVIIAFGSLSYLGELIHIMAHQNSQTDKDYETTLESETDMERIHYIINHPLFKNSYEKIEECEKNRIYCKHNMEHFLDVARLAWIFNLEENLKLPKEIVYATALLHDIGRHEQYLNQIPHETASVDIAVTILKDCKFLEEEIIMILSAIGTHRNVIEKNNFALNRIIYRADKMSRKCFSCNAIETCNWDHEKKNLTIQY